MSRRYSSLETVSERERESKVGEGLTEKVKELQSLRRSKARIGKKEDDIWRIFRPEMGRDERRVGT
jgi:hypothetical protein